MDATNQQPGQVIEPTSPGTVQKVEEEVKTKTRSVWSSFWQDEIVVKARRTFMQAFTISFVAGLADLFKAFAHGGLSAAESALLALIIGAGSAGASAVWNLAESYMKNLKNNEA